MATSLAIATVAFHAQIAAALVARGDEFLLRSQLSEASKRYARALRFDADSRVAVDRYIFAEFEMRRQSGLSRAVRIASEFLTRHPTDAMVLADRALCRLVLREYADSARDFEAAARNGGLSVDYIFAGWANLRAGRRRDALTWWHAALAIHPGYQPALSALRRFR